MNPSLRRVSVTEVARRYGRSGDLGRHQFSLLRGVEGIRVHQRVQKDRGPDYQREVSVKTEWLEGGLELFGRIDGLESSPDGPVIEEIKTCRHEEGPPESDRSMHRLQARLYAWMWWRNFGVCPQLRVCWVHPDPGQPMRQETWRDPPEQLDGWVTDVLNRYAEWTKQRQAWIQQRNASLEGGRLPFPELRPGQREMIDAVDEVMASGGRLDVQAPTGIGKTLAVLVPGLRALGRGEVEMLVVATHRNAGKNVMEDALRLLTEKGARVHALTLVARERVCRETGTPCDCEACPLAKGFYDRLEAALADLRTHFLWDTRTWKGVAGKHRVCPFAFLMAAAREADVLVGDVNYALDPSARLEWLFGERPESVGLLIDEAHHLPDRARGMLSASLDTRRLSAAVEGDAASALRRVQREVRVWQRENLDREGLPLPEAEAPERPARACVSACEVLEAVLATMTPDESDSALELLRMLRDFHLSVDRRLDSHLTYREGRTVTHLCRDASNWLRERFRSVHAVVLFSATLDPLDSFRRLTGGDPEDRRLRLESPFHADQLTLEVEKSIPMVWKARTAQLYDRLSSRIQAYLGEQPGKSLVFLPSYAVLKEVADRLPAFDLLTGPVQVQPRGLQEEGAEAFLEPFRAGTGPVTGLAVLGGALNEGIDLPGEALTTVVVVSIGLPGVCRERELLRDWFQQRDGEGFLYAYTVPGLVRVRQAVGRVVRGPEDRGRALLIDPRFDHPFYRDFF